MEPALVEAAIPGAGNSHGAAPGEMRDFRMSDKKLLYTTSKIASIDAYKSFLQQPDKMPRGSSGAWQG